MQRKVKQVTQALFEEGHGDVDLTAEVFANVCNQRKVKPFVGKQTEHHNTPKSRFADNVVTTLHKLKDHSSVYHSGSPADVMRRAIIASGAEGPLSNHKLSRRGLARVCGYGNNPNRIQSLCDAKQDSTSVSEFVHNVHATGVRKTRKDKLSGDAIWQKIWHEFTDCKKGQQFRSKMITNARIKDPVTGKFIYKSTWERHSKHYMKYTIAEMLEMVLKWEPYQQWRADYLLRNPNLPPTWNVGIKRLYKEKCFCVDQTVCELLRVACI